jgi:hypothetical protein
MLLKRAIELSIYRGILLRDIVILRSYKMFFFGVNYDDFVGFNCSIKIEQSK